MSPACEALVKRLANYDKTEECWELRIPLPRAVSAVCQAPSIDDVMEFDEWAEAHGIYYNNVIQNLDSIDVNGICMR